ncbi:pyruvate kinase [Weissella paramesenteroides]|jgi:pyruvate kinase|uniref:pyruvate kinase n=1 Tax=Weissella paramesenteroides TaxID=1249 RepID=UPI001125E43C|nr:pyruvate kinase [Weissella paramesenteroides]KAA8439054.1 pyruvate kinase [Weissella paramesenteroides]KAA8440238.1 pyruvate kinase [Weissella paramesenteroides]KAA8443851.1 pyruvate kinase [Weissella paramesenteroides]KAA8444941.1 pyruvate kinase [Weissella paramesenteroides]KAA8448924.1 pyruvate kinase [Weissella paramesenteroides]
MKKTKIVSTLGPASSDVETITKIIESGANVVRFNFSHGDHEEHLGRMNAVREAEKAAGKKVGFLLDTKGAEIRTTVQEPGKIEFNIGDVVRISMDASIEGTKEKIAVTYPGLFDDVHVGGHVLFDDGKLDMVITEKDDANKELVTEVQNHGILGSRKGVNAPGVSINLPGITEKDADDIRFGLKNGIQYIAASFVRKAADVLEIRELLTESHHEEVMIFPKIESQEGIDNFDEILEVSDGLMIARGDMGVEIPAENVPLVQKNLIRRLNAAGKPVITATDMLDSMQENPRPTRAEASDVANAVFDGTDATMLSGESANGAYPVEAVATMARIDEKAETSLAMNGRHDDDHFDPTDVTESVASAVANAAGNLNIKAIVAATNSGYTAKMISKYRPNADILALTFTENVQRMLNIYWGVQPTIAEPVENTDAMIDLAKKEAVKAGLASKGDTIIVTAGIPVTTSGTTNLMTIVTID